MIEGRQKLEQKSSELSFEDFSTRSGNFFAHFENDGRGDIHRNINSDHYKKLQDENPALVTKLRSLIAKRNRDILPQESIGPFLTDLYEAYKIMRKSGASDLDLFT